MIHIEKKTDCCGCRACEQSCPVGAISMKKDREGFLYPVVDKSICTGCGLCGKVCPVKQQPDAVRPENCFAAISNNDEIRRVSSSGGVFSELAEFVINKGGVVFGAAFNDNYLVSHIMVSNLGDLKRLRGSKYLQSDTGDSFALCRESLEKGIPVLYSGTPCQIAGLKRFLRKEYSNLFLVDVICHGVPSPDVWQRYLQGRFGQKAEIDSVSFRDKTNGWRLFGLAVSQDGSVDYSSMKENVYMQLFLQNIILRPSCYQCPAKSGKSGSDITVADFWGIENVVPDMDDDKGVSLVLVNTPRGQELWDSIERKLVTSPVSFDDVVRYNQFWAESVRENGKRKRFFRCYRFWRSFDKRAASLLEKKVPYHQRVKAKLIQLLRRFK